MIETCFKCEKPAVWSYMPGQESACDKHVPRGCSCNMEPKDGDWESTDLSNYEEPIDEQGRKFPCCEWMKL